MRDEVQAITQVDRLIHEPARLAIVAVLSSCASADFKALLHLTGLTKGNLSVHLQKLEDAGYVAVTKGYRGRTPTTDCALTESGRAAFRAYWAQVRQLGVALDHGVAGE